MRTVNIVRGDTVGDPSGRMDEGLGARVPVTGAVLGLRIITMKYLLPLDPTVGKPM